MRSGRFDGVIKYSIEKHLEGLALSFFLFLSLSPVSRWTKDDLA